MGNWTIAGAYNVGNIYFKNALQNAVVYIGLFTNDLSGMDLTNIGLADLVEPTSTDYARQSLLPTSWVVTGGVCTYPSIEWMVEAEAFGNVRGCFIASTISGTSGNLFAIHVFPAAVVMSYYGDRLSIQPRIQIT